MYTHANTYSEINYRHAHATNTNTKSCCNAQMTSPETANIHDITPSMGLWLGNGAAHGFKLHSTPLYAHPREDNGLHTTYIYTIVKIYTKILYMAFPFSIRQQCCMLKTIYWTMQASQTPKQHVSHLKEGMYPSMRCMHMSQQNHSTHFSPNKHIRVLFAQDNANFATSPNRSKLFSFWVRTEMSHQQNPTILEKKYGPDSPIKIRVAQQATCV